MMTQFMVMLEVNPLADENKISLLTQRLGMKPTTRSIERLKILVFQGDGIDFYKMKNRLEAPKYNKYFTLVDMGKATSFELEALADEKISNFKQEWSITHWLNQGVSELGKLLGWHLLRPDYGPEAGAGEKENKKGILTKLITIAGQEYQIRIIPCPEHGENRYSFELHNATPGRNIPGGFKLSLFTEDMEDWEGNEAEAKEATEFLTIPVQVDPGNGIIWQTEPLADDYYPEPLWF